MKFETKFKKIKTMPDGKLKLLKLINFAFTLIPGSYQQKEVKAEISRLQNGGLSV
jgi:hypothetical protein